MSRNTIIAIAAAAIAGGIVFAVARRSRGGAEETEPEDLRDLQTTRPRGGRKVQRADPYRDGHATPAGGDSRPTTAPSYFKA